ncbi:MAG: transketolase [Bacteroidetes bacterium]|nr:MAG: transketolase [Bacteroidota bacterium]TAG88440.1 MAG: transketolase [Bacteroidota bacterium]
MNTSSTLSDISLEKKQIIEDYQLVCESRQASLVGRKEVFAGKAKFGIFGDGKELAQIAMASVFKNGDFRAGYYRDQTFMFAIKELTIQQFYAQLYAHPSIEADPSSAGRMMNGHFGTRLLDEKGSWKPQTQSKNVASDISPTAGQMPKLVGLAYASKLFRQNKNLHQFTDFSNQGNEIAFGTIGNASSSEGLFWEAMNAVGVLQVPLLMSVWDDEYGISVGKEHHTVKESISEALAGFQRTPENSKGFEIFVVKGWDYPALLETYQKAEKICREQHVPVLVHVTEITQQQGHSTSGSHERYKSKERLEWEKEFDCNKKFRFWIEQNAFATAEELDEIEKDALKKVNQARTEAWKYFTASTTSAHNEALQLLSAVAQNSKNETKINEIKDNLEKTLNPIYADGIVATKKALRLLVGEESTAKKTLQNWLQFNLQERKKDFNSYLYSQSEQNVFAVKEIKPTYQPDAPMVDGREVLQANFDKIFETNPLVFAIGEDVGKIGDVNQGFAGLQEKYGDLRLTDTSIREATIIGQGIGTAMRGLRPIAEIQYLDYILYATQILSDDVACMQYRTKGGQKCPLIVRTRGHRLEGIWHSGSPIATLLGCLRGIHLLVPRNMTQAAGFYNTLLQADEPAVVIECLNGYRLKEKMPENLGEFTLPLGVTEVLRTGNDVTIVTYGSMCRVVMEAAEQLAAVGIECEVIDVQTLLPFDIHHNILKSIQKTNRVVFADEDVKGGGTAFMLQKVLEEQNAYQYLDSKPITITAEDHRPSYGSDGDYFSKPSPETIFDEIYKMMHEAMPHQFGELY